MIVDEAGLLSLRPSYLNLLVALTAFIGVSQPYFSPNFKDLIPTFVVSGAYDLSDITNNHLQ